MSGVDQQAVRLVACPRPFSVDRVEQRLTAGLSITELLYGLQLDPQQIHARVFIDDRFIPHAEWEFARPSAGALVTVRVIPTGGNGGGKDVLRAVAMIGLVVAAVFTAGSTAFGLGIASALGVSAPAGFALANVAVGAAFLGASLGVNALIPPSRPKLQGLSSDNLSPTLSLTGSANQLAAYAPIPRIYGSHRVFPPHAARPYTEVVGNNQYLRLLFCVGYGPLHLSDMNIGHTPLSEFTGVELEVRNGYLTDEPIRLYPHDLVEDNLSVLLLESASWQQRTTAINAKELSVDVAFPAGLIAFDSQNNVLTRTVDVQVEYRKVGDVPWLQANTQPAIAATVTTSFTGSNNDLVFAMRAAGAAGNFFTLSLSYGPTLTITRGITTPDMRTPGQQPTILNFFEITVVQSVTTGAALKAAIEAHTDANNVLSVAHAPGNSGAGVIVLPQQGWSWSTPLFGHVFYLRGGKDAVASLSVTAASQELVRRSIRWIVPTTGQYEVRVRRVTADVPQGQIRDQVYWTALRTIQDQGAGQSVPVNKKGLCLVAMRIKATNQLNGTVDQFNCVASSELLDWDGTQWTPRLSANPASVFRDILQGAANASPLADDRIDLPTIQAFHQRCAAKGFAFNAVIDFRTTVFELLRDMLSVARASFGMRDGKYSVVEDLAQTAPVQHLTPRNSWGFKGSKAFIDVPHAIKARFVSPDKDWQQDERMVYADGYSAANATKFETLDLFGVTNQDQAWKLGRYHLAVAQLRPETYELNVDVENLVCTRGDLVRVVHDVPLFGAGSGRVKTLTVDGGGNATACVLDDTMVMDGVLSYAVRFRKADGSSVVQQIVTVAGEQSSITFTSPIPAATAPAVGDLALLGLLSAESVQMIVKEILPQADLTAKLLLVDAAPAVLTADSGTIPPYDSQITFPAAVLAPIPIIVQVLSDETVLLRDVDGALQSRIVVSVHFPSGFRTPVTRVEVQLRPVDGDDDTWRQMFAPVSGTAADISIQPVDDQRAYTIRLRSVSDTGETSAWATVGSHTVVGKSTPPPDLVTLVLEGDRLRWSYPDPPRDLAGFLVRFRPGTSRSWESATPAHEHVILTTDFFVLRQGGVQTYLVKAVDVAGNESVNAQAVTINFGGALLENVLLSTDHRALGWPGTKTNCSIVVGDLAADASTPFWTSDGAVAWFDPDSRLYWSGSFLEMAYEFSMTPPPDLLDATLKIDLTMTGDWTLEYRTDSTALMWRASSVVLMWSSTAATLMWTTKGDYLSWPGELQPLSLHLYDFRITGSAGAVQAVLQQLKVILDVPDLVEVFPDLAVPSGGLRPTLTKAFREIVVVQMDLQEDGGTAAYVKAMDKSVTLGPLIQAFNSSNAATSALVDVVVQGY